MSYDNEQFLPSAQRARQQAEIDVRLTPEDYDDLFGALATIDLVSEGDREGFVGYFDTPDGVLVALTVEQIIARHMSLSPAPNEGGARGC